MPVHSKSARIIQVEDERSDEVFRFLVADKRALSFLAGAPPKPGRTRTPGATTAAQDEDSDESDLQSLPQPEETLEEAGASAKRHTDSRLQTALTPEGLQRRLLELYRDARTMLEEQGVNILYLALGHLEWLPSGTAESARHAPLLLVPVELQRKSASERFHLRWRDEDIQENLSLAAKLKSDFGLNLPPVPD